MAPERVRLQDIKALTLYADKNTAARRTRPIPQLTCIGKPCNLYQPDAVQCMNVGGHGTDVNWKCEADLPEALRFGRMTVSCEGWSSSGDPYVLKGSCGLEYRLVQIPNQFNSNSKFGAPLHHSWLGTWSVPAILFAMLWLGIAAWMLYSFLSSCVRSYFRGSRSAHGTNRRPPPGNNPWSWGSPPTNRGGRPPSPPPPPPYSKHTPSPGFRSEPSANNERWAPGFWTGLGAGGAAAYLANSYASNNRERQRQQQHTETYDWETARNRFPNEPRRREPSPPAASRYNAMGMGEGSSSSGLGPMRRATGVGESNVR